MRKLLYVLCLTALLSSYVSAKEMHGAAVEVLSKTGLSWDGKDLPDYANGKPEVTILKIKLPPGSQLPVHKHTVINAGVLLTGQLTVVTVDKKVLYLKAGDAIVEVIDTWHYGKNEGETPAEIIVFYAGKAGAPITVNQERPLDKQQSLSDGETAAAR